MKKIVAIILAATMVLNINITAFAEIYINGSDMEAEEYQLDGNANRVSVDFGETLTVNGSINTESGQNYTSVDIETDGSTVIIRDNVTNASKKGAGIVICDDNASVTVGGNVSMTNSESTKTAINVTDGAIVQVGGNISHSGNGFGIIADGEGTEVTVRGNMNLTNTASTKSAIDIANYASVEISGSVINDGNGSCIVANNGPSIGGAVITVDKDVKITNREATKDTIKAYYESIVAIGGDVVNAGNGNGINAEGKGTKVTVDGNINTNTKSKRYAVSATGGAYVIVSGNVNNSTAETAIDAYGDDTLVIIGGDVITNDGTAVCVRGGSSEVIIEGNAVGDLKVIDNGELYLGELDGEIVTDSTLKNIHYLIGMNGDSSVLNNLTLESDIISKDEPGSFATIDGVINDNYYCTTGADLADKTITLKSNDSSKVYEVSGLPDKGVTTETKDNIVTLSLNGDFKGGLQNLILTLKDIIYDIFVDTDGNGNAESDPTEGKCGTEVNLSSAPNDKYEFDFWEVVSGDITIDNNKFNIGTKDVVIKAHFKKMSQPTKKRNHHSYAPYTGTSAMLWYSIVVTLFT